MSHQTNARNQWTPEDYKRFTQSLREETRLLKQWLEQQQLGNTQPCATFAVETPLVDGRGQVARPPEALCQQLGDDTPQAATARLNLVFQGTAHSLLERPFSSMAQELQRFCHEAGALTQPWDNAPLMLGTMTGSQAVEQLETMAAGAEVRPQWLDGVAEAARQPGVSLRHDPANLTVAASSPSWCAASGALQPQLTLTPSNAGRCYNAALLISAVTVAVAANGARWWQQTSWQAGRIPLLEQALSLVSRRAPRSAGDLRRATFGSGYGRDALYQLFVENRQHYPILWPWQLNQPQQDLPHLRLHNSTVWRWNRPRVDVATDGAYQLYLEHCVMDAGPTVVDMTANTVLFHGLVQAALQWQQPLQRQIHFAVLEHNFYRAARDGLAAEVEWLDGKRLPLSTLLLEQLLPQARHALARLGLPDDDYQPWLDVIQARVRTGQTGTAWQQAWCRRHGDDPQALAQAYAQQQATAAPVHEWTL